MRALFFATLSLLALWAIVEIVFRVSDDFGFVVPAKTAALSRKLGYPVFAGQAWRHQEFLLPEANNHAGYRGAEFTARRDSPIRIAILGDSFVRGNQVLVDKSFVALADAALDSVQLMALGKGGRYLPEGYRFFRDGFEALFGQDGEYPQVDAVVFCTRQWCIDTIVRRERDYGLVYPDPRLGALSLVETREADLQTRLKAKAISPEWRLSYKRRAVELGTRWTDAGVIGPSHALSYLSNRAGTWIREDWVNTVEGLQRGAAKIFTPAASARAAQSTGSDAASNAADTPLEMGRTMYRDQVLTPLLALCRERGLPCAFVYLTSSDEAQFPDSPSEQRTRRATLRALAEVGAPHIDTLPYMNDPAGMYWLYDKHPNEKGHEAIARALATLIESEILPRIEPRRPRR